MSTLTAPREKWVSGTIGVAAYLITALLFLCGNGCGLIWCYPAGRDLPMFFCVHACIFCSGLLEFPLGKAGLSFLSCPWFSSLINTLHFFLNSGKRDWGSFALLLIPRPKQGLSAFYQMHKKTRVFLVSLVCGARSHKSHIGPFFFGG